MENKHFDKKIREKLQDLEGDFFPSDWSAFEQRLDLDSNPATEPELEDLYFDGVVHDKLNEMEVPYQESHWQLMSQKLDDAFSWRRKIYKYKVIELALMSLAIFTFVQFMTNHEQQARPIENQTNKASVEMPKAQLVPTTTEDVETIALTNADAASTKESQQLVKQGKANASKAENLSIVSKASTSSSTPSIIGTNPSPTTTAPLASFKQFAELPKVSTKLLTPVTVVPQDKKTNSSQQQYLSQSNTQSETLFPALEKNAANLSNAPERFSQDILPIGKQALLPLVANEKQMQEKNLAYTLPKLKQTGLRFGMFSTMDYNYVLTPYDVLFENEAGIRTAIGYSAGFSLGFRFTRFELETGASFAVNKYTQNLSEIVGLGNGLEYLLIDELKDIELNVLKVPLNLRYTFAKFGKWHTYVLSGFFLYMAIQANYDRQQTFLTNASARGFNNFKANLDEPLALDNKKYPDGLLEGGNFMENSYFTTNLGLGIEHILSPRWSLFFQPSYHHFIQISEERLGPNKDRINTFSISAGAKVNLK
ncbi:MAG: hypothetical protein AB8G15_04915 [Saprospiraceae bacterium]